MVRPNLEAALAKQSHKRWSASCERAVSAQSSANRRSRIVKSLSLVEALKWLGFALHRPISNLDFIPIPSVESLNAIFSMTEKNMEKSVGARTHPCLVPLVTPNGCDRSQPFLTVTFMPSWNDRIRPTKCLGHPTFSRIAQRPGLLTVSNALVKSMKSR